MNQKYPFSPLVATAILTVAALTTHAQNWVNVYQSVGVCGDLGNAERR